MVRGTYTTSLLLAMIPRHSKQFVQLLSSDEFFAHSFCFATLYVEVCVDNIVGIMQAIWKKTNELYTSWQCFACRK